jgi:cobalamin biosynthesis protein CobT
MEEYRIRTACFLILSFTIVLVASAGILNNYMNKSWAYAPLTLDDILKNYYIKIQDKSENDLEISSEIGQDSEGANQTGSDLTDQALSANQTGSDLTDQALNGEEDSEDNNQTSTQATGESESNQNNNQTIETQQQTQNNQTVNIQNNIQLKQKLEIAISEEEGEAPIPLEDQNRIESSDRVIVTQHKALTGPDCKTGNVLAGASNEEDLRVLSECQDVTGIVMHTKKMDDGDYKFFLKLDDKFKFLANEKNNDKTDGFLVVEIVPSDQGKSGVLLPKEGDHVHVWGAWVTDKPKGWHEIHPTWKVVNE